MSYSDQLHQLSFPTDISFGRGTVMVLPDYLAAKGWRRPLLVTDGVVAGLPFFEDIVKALKSAGALVSVFMEMHKNPVKSDVIKGNEAFIANDADCIVGIGGGVAMDVARAIALSIHNKRDLFDYDDLQGGDRFITEPIPPLIMVPTTSGTGSEVGRSAIIAEDESKAKRILFHPTLMAIKVFADPSLTDDLPPFITAATGMDALTHNMEAYIAKGYNPLCSGIALQGITLIANAIEKAVHDPDPQSRHDMMMGSMMGAIAFQKGLGVVHSLAHPMSALLDTHHGLANAVNLPYGMAFNYSGSEALFDDMAYALGLGSGKGAAIPEYLFELNERLNIPIKLGAVGVENQHIDELSRLAFADFCHPNNPKPVSQSDFKTLYQQAL